MSAISDQDVIDSATRTIQIIAGALIAGVVMFLGVSIAIASTSGGGRGPGDLLRWVAVAFAATALPLSFLIPKWMTDQNRRSIAAGTWAPPAGANRNAPPMPESDAGKLASVYMTQFIVGAALNEAPAFLACIAYLIGKDPIALGLASLLLGALIVRFPTRARIASWIEEQQDLLALDRQAAP